MREPVSVFQAIPSAVQLQREHDWLFSFHFFLLICFFFPPLLSILASFSLLSPLVSSPLLSSPFYSCVLPFSLPLSFPLVSSPLLCYCLSSPVTVCLSGSIVQLPLSPHTAVHHSWHGYLRTLQLCVREREAEVGVSLWVKDAPLYSVHHRRSSTCCLVFVLCVFWSI